MRIIGCSPKEKFLTAAREKQLPWVISRSFLSGQI